MLPVSVNVSGTSSEVEKLYRVLDAEPRLFVINNFSVTPSASKGSVTLQIDVFYACRMRAPQPHSTLGVLVTAQSRRRGVASRVWLRVRKTRPLWRHRTVSCRVSHVAGSVSATTGGYSSIRRAWVQGPWD